MKDMIYLLCVEKERLTEGIHYHPVINTNNLENIDVISCNDLIELQKENRDLILNLINNCENVIIVPINLETYNQLRDELKKNIDHAQEALSTAYESLKKAYEIMGRELPMDQSISETTKKLISKNSSSGKCLNESLEIVDSDASYKEKYYNDLEEDEDYEDWDEDDDYDDEFED